MRPPRQLPDFCGDGPWRLVLVTSNRSCKTSFMLKGGLQRQRRRGTLVLVSKRDLLWKADLQSLAVRQGCKCGCTVEMIVRDVLNLLQREGIFQSSYQDSLWLAMIILFPVAKYQYLYNSDMKPPLQKHHQFSGWRNYALQENIRAFLSPRPTWE